jgi:uridylate kinase
MTHPDAVRYDRMTYARALDENLKIMDASAFSLCRENSIPIIVFNFFTPGSIEGILSGEQIGTLVTS